MRLTEIGRTTFDFSADSASSPFTWGQLAIWKSIKWLGRESAYFNLHLSLPVPPVVTDDEVLNALRTIVERHEVLRTLFSEEGEGTASSGETERLNVAEKHGDTHRANQTVVGQGSFTVAQYTSPHDPTEEDANDLGNVIAAEGFDHRTEFGLRLAVLSHGGSPRHLIIAVSHLCADLAALLLISQDLAALLRGAELPSVRWRPRDEAAREGSPEGTLRCRSALNFWEQRLNTLPRSHFDHPPVPGATPDSPDRFVRLQLRSPAGAVAATVLADRLSTSVSTVLLTATAVALAGYSGHPTVALQLISGNRSEERVRELVAARSENALYVMDLPDGTFEDAIRASFRPALSAYRHGAYDPIALDRLLESVAMRRGAMPDLACFFNDARMHDGWEQLNIQHAKAFQSPAGLAELAAASEIEFVGAWPRQDAKYFVHSAPSADSLLLNLMADTRLLSRSAMERQLLAMERLLVESAFGQVAVGDAVAPADRATRPVNWVFADGSWCDPDAVANLVSAAADGADVTVDAVPCAGPDRRRGHELVAVSTGGAETLTPQWLHARVVAALGDGVDVVAPHRYVIRGADGRTLAEGSGRPNDGG
ncbi:condensation domain-containing protein [[Kitasatospora] papulosa]|uniref:condensation domain-containing protein n=1 Tax=[Kitasatospora] papulosa TaxID=1464011 RepID=UPI002E329BFF|nr:condensation domain-containing protein [[Kitasatospora] papulosa]